MKTIPLDLDVYDYLLKNTSDFGETPSSVLRRLLNLPGGKPQSKPSQTALETFLHSTSFQYQRGVVGKFLALLGWLYLEHKEMFHLVEGIKGRGRLYFATSPEPLHETGRSVNPKQVPGSPYWVITTTPTPLKLEIMEKAMQAFGYSDSEIKKALEELAD